MAQTANININVNSKQAQDNVNQLSNSIGNATKSSVNLKVELKQITRELQGLEPGSARFQELSQRAGQLRDTIQDTNAVINATAGNVTENFGRALSSATQIGVAGFQSVLAAQTLFGTENEEINKSLVKFGALLNLTQAIETFGGLGDKITQIKSGFMGLAQTLGIVTVAQQATAVAATEVAVAEGAEAVAADVAAVSTTGLAVSLNALPLVAIVTALGLLVGGLIAYSVSASKAEEEEAKRKKQLEGLQKAQEASAKSIADESYEFVNLITQLRETNKGSKERKTLITQINKQYGTTLQNLSDENKFQEQLNTTIREYITLKENEYRLSLVEDQFKKVLKEKIKAQAELNTYTNEQQDLLKGTRIQTLADLEAFKNTERIKKMFATETNRQFAITLSQIRIKLEAVDREDAKLQSLTKRQQVLNASNNEITKDGERYIKITEEKGDAQDDVNDKTDLYASLLENIKNKLTRQAEAEKELEKITTSRIDNVQEREIELLNKQYGDEKQKLIDGSIAREIAAFEEKFKAEGKSQADYDKGIAEIKAKGDGNLLDSEKKLLEAKKTFLDEDIQNIKDKYTLEEQITIQSTKSIQDQIELMDLEFQKSQEIREITNGVETEEKKQEAILEVKKKYLDKEVELIKRSGQDQISALTLQKDKQLQNEELTAGQRKEIETKYNQDVLKINQETQTKVQETIDGTKGVQESALESLTNTLNTISKYVDKIAEIWSQAGDLIAQRNEERFNAQSQQIDNLYDKEKESLDGQLRNELISREEYDNKIKQLDQQRAQEETQLALKKFNETKKLNIVNATIQGTQAVLAAYASGAATPIIGLATGPIYAAIAAAFAAAQVAMIANQTFTAAYGGIVPGDGPSNIDSIPSMLAPGEFVINSQSAKMYPQLLSQINESGGGKQLVPDLPASNTQGVPSTVFQQDSKQQPIRAYVVETDVSSTQRRVDRIKRSVEF
jgi:hypothetical protein